MICMRCNLNFNFKNKFREHVRETHVKKFVKNSFFSIDTFDSICETIKKSTIIDLFVSFVSQKLDISIATLKHNFEFVIIFETIISSENSHFSSNASKTVSKSMKNESNQCFFAQMFSFFRTFEIIHSEICVQKFSKFCTFFTNRTFNLVCETLKISTIVSFFSVSFTTLSKQISKI